jgi:hypothetical protein
VIVGRERNRVPPRQILSSHIALRIGVYGQLRAVAASAGEEGEALGLLVEEIHGLVDGVQEKVVLAAMRREIGTGMKER